MSTPVDTAGIRSAVTALPGVVRVHGRGPNGVAADDTEVEVHVVARYGEVLPDLAARVDRELAPLLGGRRLRLVVDDVATGDEPDDDEADSPAALGAGAAASAPALPAGATPAALPPATTPPPAAGDGDDA